ncbi:hypothetical protein BDR26DRAFT_936509 [Obelidium mucronatum]|nr:hypothetical protein BDR26DRAFT_936509 [Obelidium mucronatum]
MFPPVQENASLDSATAPEIEAGLESDQKPPPDLDQLNQIFLNLGLNDRTIRSFSAAAKLRILELSETANTSTTKESPNHLIRKIKSVKVKTKVLDELKVHITGETPSWTMEFLEGGGITHLLQLIESVLMKPKK